MSYISPSQTIVVNIRGLGQAGRKAILQELWRAIDDAARRAVNEATTLAGRIVPESIFRVPPYPPGYRSQYLLRTMLETMFSSVNANMQGLSRYTVRYGFPASYARYVNLMGTKRVHWSKAGSQAPFYGPIKQTLLSSFRQFLREEFEMRQDIPQGELRRGLGVVRLG